MIIVSTPMSLVFRKVDPHDTWDEFVLIARESDTCSSSNIKKDIYRITSHMDNKCNKNVLLKKDLEQQAL